MLTFKNLGATLISRLIIAALVTLCIAASNSEAFAQSSPSGPQPNGQSIAPRDLSQVSLEDLMNIEVTSVSKKEQKMSQAAAAIFVITEEDISRSGAANIPDLLRMVPGMDVSQIDANSWAVSARGFNGQFSNKLLVLTDGRAVYTPLLGGVNWDTLDVPLQDIDRIEVIRGPGATIWGANAVNGVINIVTKKASETHGAMITGNGGSESQVGGVTQYGGAFHGNTDYRIFTKYLNHGPEPAVGGGSNQDDMNFLHGGVRVDSNISSKDSLTVEGDLYTGRSGATIIHVFSISPPVVGNLIVDQQLSGGNVLGRWNHNFSGGSDTSLQFYFDNSERTGPESRDTLNTIDIDFNHHFALGSRHDFVWGAGFRRIWDHDVATIDQGFIPAKISAQLFTLFAQDTITLKPERVFLTLGSKIENSYFSNLDYEPSVRLAWTPSKRMTLWSSISRATRSPTRRDVGLNAALAAFPDPGGSSTPVEVILFGNPKFLNEHVVSSELGFRAQPNEKFSLDVSTFFNYYDNLQSLEPGPEVLQITPVPARLLMPITFGNLTYGTTEGGELSANFKLTDRWTLSPGYAFLEMHLHVQPESLDTSSVAEYQGSSPQHQAQLRSHVDLSHGLSWDSSAYFVSALPIQGVTSYTRLDTQLKWKIAERGEISVVGQNLLHNDHLESADALTVVNSSLIKRSAYAKFIWRFW